MAKVDLDPGEGEAAPGAVMPARSLRPRDAATLVLVRHRRRGLEVLLGQRGESQAFYPNRYVFPGGRVDAGDHRVEAASPLDWAVAARLTRACTPARAHALAVAAVRETAEETGLVLAGPLGNARGLIGAAWAPFRARGLAPALAGLDYVFRAVTPPGRPRRFNARFFMAEAETLSGELEGSGELGKLGWVALDQARALPIPQVTLMVLAEVERLLAVPGARDPDRPVKVFKTIHGRHVLIEE